jgi:cytochrome c oxidase cbb3-type subunit 2
VGGRYSDDWHYAHMMDPRSVVPESNMPAYAWLADAPADDGTIQKRMTVLKDMAGHPYTDDDIAQAPEMLKDKTQMDALIAYLQVLGTYGPKAN